MNSDHTTSQYLIIGTSAAGLTAALELRKLAPTATITCLTNEAELPYNKCFLVDYLAGTRALSQLYLRTPEFLAQQNITLRTSTTVTAINALAKTVLLATGEQLAYQQLLLATGARPFVPAIPGLDQIAPVYNFYNLADTLAIEAKLQQLTAQLAGQRPVQVTVIGAGLTGLECADALWRRGVAVTIIERGAQVLGSLIDPASAEFLQAKIRAAGVQLLLNTRLSSLTRAHLAVSGAVYPVASGGASLEVWEHSRRAGQSQGELVAVLAEFGAESLVLDSTQSEAGIRCELASLQADQSARLHTDLIILATGLQANLIPVMGTELATIQQHIQVDQYLATSVPGIWAAGDAIVLRDPATGNYQPSRTWPDAVLQGRIAARNLWAVSQQAANSPDYAPKAAVSALVRLTNEIVVGAAATATLTPYTSPLAYYQSHFFGLDFVVGGTVSHLSLTPQLAPTGSLATYSYNHTQQLQGFILLGDISSAGALKRQLAASLPV